MKQVQAYQWRIATGGLLVLSILVVFFALLPYLTQTLERQQVLSSQQQSIAFMSDWKRQQEVLTRQREVLTEYLQSAQSSIPTNGEFPAVIKYLFTTASREGVRIENMLPGKQLEERLYQRLVSIKSTGEYHAIGSFVNKIEQSNYVVRIIEIEIEQDDLGTISAELLVEFTVRQDTS